MLKSEQNKSIKKVELADEPVHCDHDIYKIQTDEKGEEAYDRDI